MAIGDDFSVSAVIGGVGGDVRYTGAGINYTGIEVYRFLQGLASNGSSSGDDILDVTDAVPAERSTDFIFTLNAPYNIDDATAEHIYAASITQLGGDTVYSGLKVIGSVNSASTELQIIQNNTVLTSYWGTGLNNADGSLLRIMLKTRDGGVDIDGQRIRVQARELGDSFQEFPSTLGLGEISAAITTVADLNNQTAAGTIAGWTSIAVIEGLRNIDLDNGNGVNQYLDEWTIGTQSLNDLFERTKWIQRRGTGETIHGIDGDLYRGITHSFAYDNESGGPFAEDEVLSWGTGLTAGTGLLLALSDDGSTGNMYIQLLTGIVLTDGLAITGGTSSATCDVNGAVTERSISPTFIGTSTGTNINGAYGVGIEPDDISASDKLFDLTNTQQSPPNNQTFTVANLISGEDYVVVSANDGADAIDNDQFTLNTTLSGAAETSVVITTPIPTDTPSAGTIRVFTDAPIKKRLTYTSYTGSTFTIDASDFSSDNATAGNNSFVTYIDTTAGAPEEDYTAIFGTPRSLVVDVRNGINGTILIKPFITPATFGAAGGSVSTIRTPDV